MSSWPHTFSTQYPSVALSWLDDQFNQLSSAATSTVTLGGASLVGYQRNSTSAVATTVQQRMYADCINVFEFMTSAQIADVRARSRLVDVLSAVNAAIAAANSLGGGKVFFPAGDYLLSAQLSIGNGSNTTQSTIDHKILLVGEGYGTGPSVSDTQKDGVTTLVYGGSTDTTKAVVSFEGPLHSVGMENMMVDCDSKAGIGMQIIHITQGTFRRVAAINYTTTGWRLTTRTGFPTGVGYGNADNRFYDCYAFDPSNFTANAIEMNSGVSSASSLTNQPDSARNVWIGGEFYYGGNTSSYGVLMQGADNNVMIEPLFFPKGGNAGGGFDIYYLQWPTGGDFPAENWIANPGMTRGPSGNGGVGSSRLNWINPYPSADSGVWPPPVTCVNAFAQDGRLAIAGVSAYRGRQINVASTQAAPATSGTAFVDVTGLSVSFTSIANTKVKINFSGSAGKTSAGYGDAYINLAGSDVGPSLMRVPTEAALSCISSCWLADIGAGTQTVKIRFASSDTNTFTINNGVLIVEELY